MLSSFACNVTPKVGSAIQILFRKRNQFRLHPIVLMNISHKKEGKYNILDRAVSQEGKVDWTWYDLERVVDGDDGLLEDHAGPLWYCHDVVRRFWCGMDRQVSLKNPKKARGKFKVIAEQKARWKRWKSADKSTLPQGDSAREG